MTFSLCVFLLLSLITLSSSDHFKGGSISWRPTNPSTTSSPVEVVITYRYSWTLSRYQCNLTTINSFASYNDTQTASTTSIQCISSNAICTAALFQSTNSTLFCTDYSKYLDISTGTYYSVQNLLSNSIIDIASRGGSWVSTTSANDWSLVSHIDLTPINGAINNSPVTGSLPVIQVFVNEYVAIEILAHDMDKNQTVRCRWSYQNTIDECGSECFDLPNAVLSPLDCSIGWTGVLRAADVANGLNTSTYVVSITAEDYVNASSTTPLSSVPHQVLVQVLYKPTNSCSSRPSINSFLLRNQACYALPYGSSLSLTFQGSINKACLNHTIVEFLTTTPLYTTKTNIIQLSNFTWYTIISWTPRAFQVGLHPICAAAIDEAGQTSLQYCVMIAVGASSFSVLTPSFVQSTASPLGTVLATQMEFSIQANLPLKRTRIDGTYINIYKVGTGLIRQIDCKYSGDVYFINQTLLFYVRNPPWTLGSTYYIDLTSGVATADQYCGTESGYFSGSNRWRFTIWNPSGSSTTTPSTTTSTATTHTVTTRVMGTTTYNTLYTTTGLPLYTTITTTSTTSTTSTSATTTTTTSATTSTTSTTTTTVYVADADVIYPKDFETACLQPVTIVTIVITSVMIPIRLFGMIYMLVKMTRNREKEILRSRLSYRKRLQKKRYLIDEEENFI